jgi:hypothetical protein
VKIQNFVARSLSSSSPPSRADDKTTFNVVNPACRVRGGRLLPGSRLFESRLVIHDFACPLRKEEETVPAAPSGAGPYFVTRCILSMLQESRLIVVVLYQDRTAINDNGLPGAEASLHQEQIGLRDLGSFADSANRETVAHALV